MVTLTTQERAALMQRTQNAYSFERYGAANWIACVEMLDKRGLSEDEIEIVLRSKITRWAGDFVSKSDGVTADDLARFCEYMISKSLSVRSLDFATAIAALASENYGEPRKYR